MCIEKDDLAGILAMAQENRQRLDDLETDLREAISMMQPLVSDTREIVEMFVAFKGAWKVLHWIGKLAKPMAYIVAAFTATAALWTKAKGGEWPLHK